MVLCYVAEWHSIDELSGDDQSNYLLGKCIARDEVSPANLSASFATEICFKLSCMRVMKVGGCGLCTVSSEVVQMI